MVIAVCVCVCVGGGGIKVWQRIHWHPDASFTFRSDTHMHDSQELPFRVFAPPPPLRGSNVNVSVGQQGLCPHSQRGQRPLSGAWTPGGWRGGGSACAPAQVLRGLRSSSNPSQGLRCQAGLSAPPPLLVLWFWPRHPAVTEAETGIGQHKLPHGTAYD